MIPFPSVLLPLVVFLAAPKLPAPLPPVLEPQQEQELRAAALHALDAAERRAPPLVIGVQFGEVGEALAAQLGLESGRGVLVMSVTPGGPAERAGLRVYDVLLAADGAPLEAGTGLRQAVEGKTAGGTLQIELLRNGQRLEIEVEVVTLGQLEESLAGARGLAHGLPMLVRQRAAIESLRAAQAARRADEGLHRQALEELLRAKAGEQMPLEELKDRLAVLYQQKGEASAALARAVESMQEHHERAAAVGRAHADRLRDHVHRLGELLHEKLPKEEREKLHAELQRLMREADESVSNALEQAQLPVIEFFGGESGETHAVLKRRELEAAASQLHALHERHAGGIEDRLERIEDRLKRMEAMLDQLLGR